MTVWGNLAGAWLLGMILVLWLYRQDLLALWREPMLRHPVLIVESDDWGAGPLTQAEGLERLSGILSEYRTDRADIR
jgi:hypothetical protein